VVVICFGVFILLSARAVTSGFAESPLSETDSIWLMAIELASACGAIAVLYNRNYAVLTLLPRPSLRGSAIGIALFAAAWLAAALIVAPFAALQPEPPAEAADPRLSLALIVMTAMVNGTYEEVFLLGFLLRGLRGYGLSIAVGVALLVRVLYHLYQGPVGALWVLGFGAAFSVYYLRSEQLWPPAFAHILWDIIPLMGGQG